MPPRDQQLGARRTDDRSKHDPRASCMFERAGHERHAETRRDQAHDVELRRLLHDVRREARVVAEPHQVVEERRARAARGNDDERLVRERLERRCACAPRADARSGSATTSGSLRTRSRGELGVVDRAADEADVDAPVLQRLDLLLRAAARGARRSTPGSGARKARSSSGRPLYATDDG